MSSKVFSKFFFANFGRAARLPVISASRVALLQFCTCFSLSKASATWLYSSENTSLTGNRLVVYLAAALLGVPTVGVQDH